MSEIYFNAHSSLFSYYGVGFSVLVVYLVTTHRYSSVVLEEPLADLGSMLHLLEKHC